MEATLTKGVLGLSEGLLNGTFGFLHLALSLQIPVICNLANGLLGSALDLLRATLDAVLVHPSLSSTRGRWGLLQRLGPDILSTVVTGEVFPKTCMGAADQQSSKRHQWLYCSDNQSYRFTAFPDGVRKVPPDGFMVALDGAALRYSLRATD